MKKNGFTPLDRTQYHLRRDKIVSFFCKSFRPCTIRQKYLTGFTLVEILVVIAIIILVSVVTVPIITPFLKAQRLSKGARIVQASALAARTMAINSRKTRQLVFDSTYSKLTIMDENSNVLGRDDFLPSTIEFGTSTGSWTAGTSTVSFDPNGSADTSTLGTDTVIIQDKQGNSKNLKIISYTGQIKSD
ncbi:MAG: general secretion pathway protein H [Candidatus Scalindua rubra]|uniref:Type II secretion system protein H n=1 Tax=Candidatus Scalindua rubra TaxID=1872076 RepID=A0A1E3X9V7_9BACT|nr:MAG: general secretion pathway protein H [Candidatus Scalindua rubra]